jgi:hypothetical protein
MITIKNHPVYGEVDITVSVDVFSAVDSFIQSAFSYKLDRALTDDEMDDLQDEYSDKIQEYSYENGSRNHN